MKILITGGNGQLGTELAKKSPKATKIFCFNKNEFNLLDLNQCKNKILEIKPNWIINAGAYTKVDNAEKEKEREKVYSINANAVELLARTVSSYGGRLLQISTDFVFDGKKSTPYQPQDILNPLNVYGASKRRGEELSLKYDGTIILRTSWLYSNSGDNFFLKILEHNKKNKKVLNIVNDQFGSPTNVINLAEVCWELIKNSDKINQNKIFHWSDGGVTTWYGFAKSIGEIAEEIGLIDKAVLIRPISTSLYPSLAKRPNYSVLDAEITKSYLNIQQTDWEKALKVILIQNMSLEKKI